MTTNWKLGRSKYYLLLLFDDGHKEEREAGIEYSTAQGLAAVWRAQKAVKQVIVRNR